MTHYVSIMRKFGPAVRYSCMRYEGFLNIPKRKAQTNFNFKNLSKSVGYHLSTVMCSNLLDKDTFNVNKVDFGPCKTYSFDDMAVMFSVENFADFFDVNKPITHTRWVSLNGFKYKKKTLIVYKTSWECLSGLPLFAEIDAIFFQNDNCIVASAYLHDTVLYDDHFHAYEIQKCTEKRQVLCKINPNPNCEPLSTVKSFCKDSIRYIVPRHCI